MKVMIGVLLVLAFLIIIVLSLPFLINLNHYQDRYRPLIEDALNRRITIEDVRLTIYPRLGVRLAGFTVLEDPAFGTGPFLSLASLDIGVKVKPLFSGRVEVEGLTLAEPVMTVVKNRHGVMNVSTLGKQGAGSPSAQPEAPPPAPEGPLRILGLLAVDRLTVTDGRLIYQDRSRPTPIDYRLDDLEVRLENVRLGDMASVHATATVRPYAVPVTIDGSIGPLVETLDLKTMDFNVQVGKILIGIKGSAVGGHAALALTAPVINAADLPVQLPLTKPVQVTNLLIEAEADYPMNPQRRPLERATIKRLAFGVTLGKSIIAVTGTLINGEAAVTATSPSVNTADLPIAVPLPQPVEITDLKMTAHAEGDRARVDDLSLTVFGGRLTSRAAVTLGPRRSPFDVAGAIANLQLGPAFAAYDTRVSVSGTAAVDFSVQGQGFSKEALGSALEGKGTLHVKDGRLEGVNVLAETVALLQAVGVKGDVTNATVFRSIDGKVSVKNGVMTIDRLLIDSPDFQGVVLGTVTFAQALDLKATLTLSDSLSRQITTAAPATRLAVTGGRLSVPLVMTGTVQSPSYALDTKAISGKVRERVKEQVKDTVDDLLKGKKIDLNKGLKRLFGE